MTERFLSSLERGAIAGLLLGSIAALLVAARNSFTPDQASISVALIYWKWLALVGVAVALSVTLLSWFAARLTRISGLSRVGLIALIAVFWCLLLAYNLKAIEALRHPGGPWRYRLGLPVSFVLATVGLLAAAVRGERFRGALRGLTALALLAVLVAFYPERSSRAAQTPLPTAVRVGAPRLLLVGVDGASWDLMDPLLARGELPHFAALRARGAWGRLKSFEPTVSPVIWTTLATGMEPDVHGIQSFTFWRFKGMSGPLPDLRPLKRMGFSLLNDAMTRAGEIVEVPITSTARKVPAYWNIASAFGSPVAVVGWWGTWPAEPVLGEIASDRIHDAVLAGDGTKVTRLTFPDDLFREIAPLVVRPEQIPYADTRRFMDWPEAEFEVVRAAPRWSRKDIETDLLYFLSSHETAKRVALHLIERGKRRFGTAPDTLLLFRIVDLTCHTSLRFSELVSNDRNATSDQIQRYVAAVSEAYRLMDRTLGELLAAFGEGNLVVVSDHGWERMLDGTYSHRKAPDGIILAAGPAFLAGRYDGLRVQDIFPLLARLKGFPIAEDLAGRVPEELFDPRFLKAHPRQTIATYGRRNEFPIGEGPAAVDREMIERLKGLGYIQ